MPNYTVKQGDHLSKIAKKHGFADWRTVWNHPNNSELRKKRENPNILCPGDALFIPDKEVRTESGNTEQRHRFKARFQTLMLRIALREFDDRPVALTDCELHMEGRVYPLKTDDKGLIEQRIPATAEEGMLVFKDPQAPFDRIPIKIGHLDPVEEISGWKARLNNLGYNAGPIDGQETEQLRSAIEEFQCDYFKDVSQVDGKCGPKTIAKLKKVYGC